MNFWKLPLHALETGRVTLWDGMEDMWSQEYYDWHHHPARDEDSEFYGEHIFDFKKAVDYAVGNAKEPIVAMPVSDPARVREILQIAGFLKDNEEVSTGANWWGVAGYIHTGDSLVLVLIWAYSASAGKTDLTLFATEELSLNVEDIRKFA